MKKNHLTSALAMVTAGALGYYPRGYDPRVFDVDTVPPNNSKCLLKGCDNMTTHKRGYCCAEHCKLDKKRT